MGFTYSHKNKFMSLMRLKLKRLFYRINLFTPMHFHEISKIVHFHIKYEFGISLKFEKSQTKRDECRIQDISDRVFINEKKNEKEKKSLTVKTVCQRNIFAKEIL